DLAQRGVSVTEGVLSGNYAGAFSQLSDGLSSSPVARDAAAYASQGASFFTSLANGQTADALGTLSTGLAPLFGSDVLTDGASGDVEKTRRRFVETPELAAGLAPAAENALGVVREAGPCLSGLARGDYLRAAMASGNPEVIAQVRSATAYVAALASGAYDRE